MTGVQTCALPIYSRFPHRADHTSAHAGFGVPQVGRAQGESQGWYPQGSAARNQWSSVHDPKRQARHLWRCVVSGSRSSSADLLPSARSARDRDLPRRVQENRERRAQGLRSLGGALMHISRSLTQACCLLLAPARTQLSAFSSTRCSVCTIYCSVLRRREQEPTKGKEVRGPGSLARLASRQGGFLQVERKASSFLASFPSVREKARSWRCLAQKQSSELSEASDPARLPDPQRVFTAARSYASFRQTPNNPPAPRNSLAITSRPSLKQGAPVLQRRGRKRQLRLRPRA